MSTERLIKDLEYAWQDDHEYKVATCKALAHLIRRVDAIDDASRKVTIARDALQRIAENSRDPDSRQAAFNALRDAA